MNCLSEHTASSVGEDEAPGDEHLAVLLGLEHPAERGVVHGLVRVVHLVHVGVVEAEVADRGALP